MNAPCGRNKTHVQSLDLSYTRRVNSLVFHTSLHLNVPASPNHCQDYHSPDRKKSPTFPDEIAGFDQILREHRLRIMNYSMNKAQVSYFVEVPQSNFPDYTNSLTFPWPQPNSPTFTGFQLLQKSDDPALLVYELKMTIIANSNHDNNNTNIDCVWLKQLRYDAPLFHQQVQLLLLRVAFHRLTPSARIHLHMTVCTCDLNMVPAAGSVTMTTEGSTHMCNVPTRH